MNKKIHVIITIITLLILNSTSVTSIQKESIEKLQTPNNQITDIGSYIIVPDDFLTIQQAIDNSETDATIYVRTGTYSENLIIDKALTLIGQEKEITIIDGTQTDSVVKVLADNVMINNFTIQNSSSEIPKQGGIESYSSNSYYHNNILLNNQVGIHILDGDNNIIIYNHISGCSTESICIHTSYNTVYQNNIEDNSYGIWLQPDASKNEIKQNNFINNEVYHAAVKKATSNKWDQNYWDNWIGLKIPTLKFLPKIIPKFQSLISWFNLDWHPLTDPIEIKPLPLTIIKTAMGDMTLQLFSDKMPITTNNYIRLSNVEFFNGLVFHRVIDDFMIQGGGRYANGTIKKSQFGTIPLETHPEVLHVDGAISMARTSDPDSATSQFFICDEAQHRLDGDYAAFGVIINGIDVLRSIASVETTTKYFLKDWPTDDIFIEDTDIIAPSFL